jgi:hypothetical protein
MKKNYLKEISEEEKNFILEMHKKMGYNTSNELYTNDKYIFEDENQDIYNSLNKDSSAKNIARVIRNSNGGTFGNDREAWAEAAFNKISDIKKYNDVTTILGQDVISYLKEFMDIDDTYYKNSISNHYNSIKQKTIKQSGLKSNSFVGNQAESIAKSYYKSVGSNIFVWQKLLKLLGKDLGNYGPNKDGIDGDWGTTSKNALKSITGSNSLNFENFKKLMFLVANDKNKTQEFTKFVKSGGVNKTKENKINDDEILDKLSSESDTEDDDSYFSWIRKIFPNFSQLLNAKKMDNDDFTDNQKNILLMAIKNSKKRVPSFVKNKKGGVTYEDYGDNIAKEFNNERGGPSSWSVIWRTITKNDSFAMATLLGKFDWIENGDGSYTISDSYDFKDPKYKELIGVNREKLEGLSIQDLSDKYNLSYYEAARTKGWVDHPDTVPEKSVPINLTIDDVSNDYISSFDRTLDPGKV